MDFKVKVVAFICKSAIIVTCIARLSPLLSCYVPNVQSIQQHFIVKFNLSNDFNVSRCLDLHHTLQTNHQAVTKTHHLIPVICTNQMSSVNVNCSHSANIIVPLFTYSLTDLHSDTGYLTIALEFVHITTTTPHPHPPQGKVTVYYNNIQTWIAPKPRVRCIGGVAWVEPMTPFWPPHQRGKSVLKATLGQYPWYIHDCTFWGATLYMYL